MDVSAAKGSVTNPALSWTGAAETADVPCSCAATGAEGSENASAEGGASNAAGTEALASVTGVAPPSCAASSAAEDQAKSGVADATTGSHRPG